jgi:hypothetical protein
VAEKSYILVKRKLVVTWIITNIAMLILIGLSFQYANIVAHQLCGVITISLKAYQNNPHPSSTGEQLESEFLRLSDKYNC